MDAFDDHRSKTGEPDTQVDLGDDLLESTSTLVRNERGDERNAPIESRIDADDHFESARILMNEGLVEEAKKVLRRILIDDPRHVPARKKLDEIHELELRQILDGSDEPRMRRAPSRAVAPDIEKLVMELDHDLGKDRAPACSLFEDPSEMADFAAKLDRDLADASARDRMDIGIAFLEMGLSSVAVQQFRAAARDEELKPAAIALHACALLAAQQPLAASEILQPLLEDPEIQGNLRLELLYWMARAHEKLSNPRGALPWFVQVKRTQPGYRDVESRIRRLENR